MKCCLEVKESGQFDISLQGVGLYTLFKLHYQTGTCFSTEAMHGAWWCRKRAINFEGGAFLYDISACAVQVKV